MLSLLALLANLCKEQEDLGCPLLDLLAHRSDIVKPGVCIFHVLLHFCVVLLHSPKHLDTARVLKHLDRLQAFKDNSLPCK